jgi:hypothetical protein
MKGSRFSEEQIIVVLREHEAGIANARALAKMYAACIGEIDGVRLLTHETMERARESQNEGLGAPCASSKLHPRRKHRTFAPRRPVLTENSESYEKSKD